MFLYLNPTQLFAPNPFTGFYQNTAHQNIAHLFLVFMRWTTKPCTPFYAKTLCNFFHQNPAQVSTSKLCIGFYSNPWTAFYTKFLHSFLHQNPAQLLHQNPAWHFTPKPCRAFFSVDQINTKPIKPIKSTPEPCTAFYTKTLQSFLHQNPA